MVEAASAIDHIAGGWQEPVNRWQGAQNSIHTDAVAQRIGMRGGTIPGTVHLTHFRPLIEDLFGERWFQTGTISMYYTYATLDREKVRAFVERPARSTDVQVAAWVENEEHKTVCKGTISVGNPTDAVPYIRSLPLENAAGTIRILAKMKPGDAMTRSDKYLISEGGEEGVLRDPQLMYRALAMVPRDGAAQPSVGFFGATEIRLHNGPIRTNTRYKKSGVVASIGDSPKTEFAWFDTFLHDAEDRLVADMRHMTRWMKASSPLWQKS